MWRKRVRTAAVGASVRVALRGCARVHCYRGCAALCIGAMDCCRLNHRYTGASRSLAHARVGPRDADLLLLSPLLLVPTQMVFAEHG